MHNRSYSVAGAGENVTVCIVTRNIRCVPGVTSARSSAPTRGLRSQVAREVQLQGPSTTPPCSSRGVQNVARVDAQKSVSSRTE